MLSKNDIKFIRSLGSSKFRKKHSLFIAEGRKVINEFLSEGWSVDKIYTIDVSLFDFSEIEVISNKELQRISQLSHAKDALAVIKQAKIESIKPDDLRNQMTIVCDRIQDPGNMGTIIRIADWFGIKNVICSPDCVDIYNSKLVQSTMGSLSRVKVSYKELNSFLPKFANEIPVLASSLNGENLYDFKLPQSCFLVLGNEANGISDEILSLANSQLLIPSRGGAESLNVAISAGIFLSEYSRTYPLNLQR